MNSPLKYHGGKSYLAPLLVALIPPHVNYIEPYAGGLSVLLTKNPTGVNEIINDIDSRLVNFWKVLRENPKEFMNSVNLTPFSEEEWFTSSNVSSDRIEDARRFFIYCRQSLAGRMRSFTSISQTRLRRAMNEQVSGWLSAIDGLPSVVDRLQKVLILNRLALDVIREFDSIETFQYLDPPYLPESRTALKVYKHEMSIQDHEFLLYTIIHLESKVMISGYDSALYNKVLSNWNRKEFSIANHSASGSEKRRMIEVIWMNY